MSKLLPCPFCGGAASVGSNANEGTAWVSCGVCLASSGGFQDWDKPMHILEDCAAREWNTRAHVTSQPKETA